MTLLEERVALEEPLPVPERTPFEARLDDPPPAPVPHEEPPDPLDLPWAPGLELAQRRPAPTRSRASPPASGPPVPPAPPALPSMRAAPATEALRSVAALEPVPGNLPPVYPLLAARLGQHGRVVVRLWVAADGHVERVEVVQGSGWPLLDAEALRALRMWRFAPRPPGPPTPPRVFDQAVRFARHSP